MTDEPTYNEHLQELAGTYRAFHNDVREKLRSWPHAERVALAKEAEYIVAHRDEVPWMEYEISALLLGDTMFRHDMLYHPRR